jgi:hypothetical protein
MNDTQTPTRLHRHMAAMLALEQTIEQQVEYFLSEASHNPEIVALLNDLQELTTNHRQGLVARLQTVAPDVPIPNTASTVSALEGLYDGVKYPASAALVNLYTLFDQGVIGYSVLLELCLRAADSYVRGSDNTADIVLRHLRDYTAAVQKIVQMLHYTVVGELEQDGKECQCICPSCGLGLCLCAIASRRFLGMAWTDAGPIYVPEAILMVKPRAGSAAATVGIQKGDLVLMVDGKGIESIPILQETVRNHKSGEEIHFQVQQKSGERVEITVVRP